MDCGWFCQSKTETIETGWTGYPGIAVIGTASCDAVSLLRAGAAMIVPFVEMVPSPFILFANRIKQI
jgi:hypothetical protein